MKVRVGADVNSGLMHTISDTYSNVADISELHNQLREADRAVFGDKVYVNNVFKRAARKAGGLWGVALKTTIQHPLTSSNKRTNRQRSSIRSRVEHI